MLIFGFKNTNSEMILSVLNSEHTDCILVDKNVNSLLTYIMLNAPNQILGIGEYSGRDQDKIRIETVCRNKFRNTIIHTNQPNEITFKNILPTDQYFKRGVGMGNSWCNLMSFEINSTFPDINFTFLHIPKSLSIPQATMSIRKKLLIPS